MVKKLVLLGFALALLVGLPLAIFVVQNQTPPTNSHAAAATKFNFDVTNLPQNIQVGQNFDVPITVDPQGQNQVSFVKVTFTYDGNKLQTPSTSPITLANTKSGGSYTVLEAPGAASCNSSSLCQMTFTISIGGVSTDSITSKTTVATIHFTAKENTDPGTPTELDFVSGQNQALSVASTDQAAENVYQAGDPATITIGATTNGGGGGTSPTPGDTTTPTPGGSGGSGGTSGGSGATGSSATVSCSSLTADVASGTAPLVVTFTAVGTSSSDTISNLALNYGDGLVDQVASGSGIGTGSVNAQTSHTYQQNGKYTATATFTTAGGATSGPTDCSQTITVGTITPTAATQSGLPPTGPGDTFLYAGAAGVVLTIVGVLLFAL